MLLALDIGNTNIKSGIFFDEKLTQVKHFAITKNERSLKEIWKKAPKNIRIKNPSFESGYFR